MIELQIELYPEHLVNYILSTTAGLGQLDQVLDDDLKAGLEEIVAYAQVYAPVDTGRLRDSIRYEGGNREYTIIADPKNPNTGRGYAVYVETGTSKMPAQPYMRPALDQVMPKLVEMLKGDLERIVTGRW